MEYVIVLDTETVDINTCFCYDLSYLIMRKEDGVTVDFKTYVVEQVWHNLPLFESAYYKEKRPKYVQMMRRHDMVMNKWGYIMQELARDIKKYNVTGVYAYNSDFDDKVVAFNCDWFHCINPLETVPVYDIWGYTSECITCTEAYQDFCEANERFTDAGNFKSSAEVVYQWVTNNPEFVEEHMGLFDAEIEAEILYWCIAEGGLKWDTEYAVKRIVDRNVPHPLSIKIDGAEIYNGTYLKKNVRNGKYSFTTK